MSTTIIRNGRVIDPANKRDEIADLYIVEGRIAEKSDVSDPKSNVEEIDAKGLIVAPGLIDMHVHLRSPGLATRKRLSRARAAAAGGFTTIVCMPNTSPVPDNPSTIAWIKDRAATRRASMFWQPQFQKSRWRRTRTDRVPREGGRCGDNR